MCTRVKWYAVVGLNTSILFSFCFALCCSSFFSGQCARFSFCTVYNYLLSCQESQFCHFIQFSGNAFNLAVRWVTSHQSKIIEIMTDFMKLMKIISFFFSIWLEFFLLCIRLGYNHEVCDGRCPDYMNMICIDMKSCKIWTKKFVTLHVRRTEKQYLLFWVDDLAYCLYVLECELWIFASYQGNINLFLF